MSARKRTAFDDYMIACAIEIAHGGGRGQWEIESIDEDDIAAAGALGLSADELRRAATIRKPHVPPPLRRPDNDQLDYDEYCEEMSIGGRRYRPFR